MCLCGSVCLFGCGGLFVSRAHTNAARACVLICTVLRELVFVWASLASPASLLTDYDCFIVIRDEEQSSALCLEERDLLGRGQRAGRCSFCICGVRIGMVGHEQLGDGRCLLCDGPVKRRASVFVLRVRVSPMCEKKGAYLHADMGQSDGGADSWAEARMFLWFRSAGLLSCC